MKRAVFIVITYVIGALALLAGCSGSSQAAEPGKVGVFYPEENYSYLDHVEKTVSSDDASEVTDELIAELSDTPADAALKRTLGDGAVIKDKKLKDGTLELDFTASYNGLNKTEEVLIRAAVVETLLQVKGVEKVVFKVEGKPLKDDEGNVVGPMTADTFINDTGTEINTYDRRTLNLYFADIDGKGLIRVKKTVVYPSNMSAEKLVVQKLIEGPGQEDEAYPTIAKDAGLLSVSTKNDTCYVNFDLGIREKPYNVSEEVVLYSIVNSLTELPGIKKVQLSVEGVSDGVLFSDLNLNTAFERNPDIVK